MHVACGCTAMTDACFIFCQESQGIEYKSSAEKSLLACFFFLYTLYSPREGGHITAVVIEYRR